MSIICKDKRELLLEFLQSEGSGDPEVDHAEAEKMLLALLDDEWVTAAWKDTPQTWWYA